MIYLSVSENVEVRQSAYGERGGDRQRGKDVFSGVGHAVTSS